MTTRQDSVAGNRTPDSTSRALNDAREPSGRFITVDEVAERLRCSARSVHELTRHRAVPHRVLPHSRRCLFDVSELRAWEDGAELEVIEPAHGGRIVRPVTRGLTRTPTTRTGREV